MRKLSPWLLTWRIIIKVYTSHFSQTTLSSTKNNSPHQCHNAITAPTEVLWLMHIPPNVPSAFCNKVSPQLSTGMDGSWWDAQKFMHCPLWVEIIPWNPNWFQVALDIPSEFCREGFPLWCLQKYLFFLSFFFPPEVRYEISISLLRRHRVRSTYLGEKQEKAKT